MNRATGSVKPPFWTLTFVGGPMNGRVVRWDFLPEPRFGKRHPETREQFWYVPTEVDRERGTAKMVLEEKLPPIHGPMGLDDEG